MADDRGVLRQIAWRDLFPWLSLARAPRIAAAPRLILLGAIGWLAMIAGWQLIGKLFPAQAADLPWLSAVHYWPISRPSPERFLSLNWLNPADNFILIAGRSFCAPFLAMLDPALGFAAFTASLLAALWELAVWAIFGGAITRIAALAETRDTRLGFGGGLAFGVMKWPAMFFAVLAPVGTGILLGLLGLFFGLLMRSDFLAGVMSVFWFVLLLSAFALAVLLVGLSFGWPLMWPTVAVEGTDSFDALSRSYSYTFQRPLRYLIYALVAGLLGSLAIFVATLLAAWTEQLAWWAAGWGAGHARVVELQQLAADAASGQSAGAAGEILAFWHRVVYLLVFGYALSYFWTAVTRIYLLLRLSVDGAEMDEIAHDDLPDPDGPRGLPPLATDESGVPRVVEPGPTPGSPPPA